VVTASTSGRNNNHKLFDLTSGQAPEFGLVPANQTVGTNDTVDEQAIDFALRTVGNWTSG
jgi:hypothetical protein